MAKVLATPGVYIEEKSAFPNSAVPVATAVPAFIGYTEKAMWNKKSLKNVPTRLSSFGEYLLYFGGAPPTTYEVAADNDSIYKVSNSKKRFLLYYSMKFFFANGGSDCYVVSIGDYSGTVTKSEFDGENPILDASNNPTGDVEPFGIRTLMKEPEPTMLVIPDAVLLSKRECADIQQAMLAHCRTMASRFAILDVPMDATDMARPATRGIVSTFRENVGTNDLQWGGSYYPYLLTTITGSDAVSFRNIDPNKNTDLVNLLLADVASAKKEGLIDEARETAITTEVNKIPDNNPLPITDPAAKTAAEGAKTAAEADVKAKQALLDAAVKANPQVPADIKKATDDLNTAKATLETALQALGQNYETIKNLHQTLLAISPLYKAIMETVQREINILPPSGGMAGIYSMVDNTIGVYQSPANVSVGSVAKPIVNLTNDEQEDLNVPLNGKAVNAIRTFPGKGTLVWGARTLDGNSQDWRYVSVRRTVIFIEQSIKYAIEPYVFAPNTATTWTNVKALITNFLNNVWADGALAGAKPEDAFSVDVGLGVTMTPVDILDGIMRVSVKIAVTRPAEFIVITFQQKMQQS